MEPFVQHTLRAARAEEIDARPIANMVYGAACSGRGKSLGMLFMVLARAAELCMDNFKAQNLANTAWAFTTVGQSEVSLFRVLARAAELCVSDFKA